MLRVVPVTAETAPSAQFCGHCGQPPVGELATRVCARCGMGVVLEARADIVPAPDQAFVVVDHTLSVCAVSSAAEELLGITEHKAVNSHVSDFLLPADAEVHGPESLMGSIIAAASGETEPHVVVVRPSAEFGVRHAIRVGRCGPPPAALLVFTDDKV